jgi:hypothetical protein
LLLLSLLVLCRIFLFLMLLSLGAPISSLLLCGVGRASHALSHQRQFVAGLSILGVPGQHLLEGRLGPVGIGALLEQGETQIPRTLHRGPHAGTLWQILPRSCKAPVFPHAALSWPFAEAQNSFGAI